MADRNVKAGAAAGALTAAAAELRAGALDATADRLSIADWLDQRAGLLAVAAMTVTEQCPACLAPLEVVDGLIVCRAGCDR